MLASYDDLIADGWKIKADVLPPRSPALAIRGLDHHLSAEYLVLEKDGNGLVYSYYVYDDRSDYPGSDCKVHWREATFRTVQLIEVVFSKVPENYNLKKKEEK